MQTKSVEIWTPQEELRTFGLPKSSTDAVHLGPHNNHFSKHKGPFWQCMLYRAYIHVFTQLGP